MDITTLQIYWWLLISVLGALLVFLLFVQGGQSLLCGAPLKTEARRLMVNSVGRKWEFTYTTLVVFGGAFFAAFPLFYSTSFGGAYWLWMLILISFVLQAVSYEFRSKPGNIYRTQTYDAFLMFNGLFGCVLLGVAVGTMFFGADFTVTRTNLIDSHNPVISQWGSLHGLEAILNLKCLLLGLMVFMLARTQAGLYFVNNIDAPHVFGNTIRRSVLVNGTIFAVLFVGFVVVLSLQSGYRYDSAGVMTQESNIYLHNLLDMPWTLAMVGVGAVLVLYAIYRTAFSSTWRCGVWYSGAGTVLVVMALFFIAGYNNTAYLPSTADAQSSLTIVNSSSSLFTLKVMGCASLVIPVVLAYIFYTWRRINNRPLTPAEIDTDHHAY